MALDHTAGRCPKGNPLAPRRSVLATRKSPDVDPPQCHGAKQEDRLLALCNILCGMVGKWMEAWWCGRAPPETWSKCGHWGGALKDEAAKPTTLDVDDLSEDVVLGLKL